MTPAVEQGVRIRVGGDAAIDGDLVLPAEPVGLIVFAHGSGSGRHSPRNRAVGAGLQERRLGTLLVDLLTPDEEQIDLRTRRLRFDIGLLAGRLEATTQWLADDPAMAEIRVGYFGASTGAAAALIAAARRPASVGAVVSRGGRPDLAGHHLRAVRAPTLLIVGGRDDVVIDLNRRAYDELRGERRIEIVPGATHLFEGARRPGGGHPTGRRLVRRPPGSREPRWPLNCAVTGRAL